LGGAGREDDYVGLAGFFVRGRADSGACLACRRQASMVDYKGQAKTAQDRLTVVEGFEAS